MTHTFSELSLQERRARPTGELVAACQQQERAAQTEFYNRYKKDVARTAYKVFGPDAELDDVVQDVFIEVFRSIHKFKGQAKVTTWLYRVTFNVALQRLRKRKRQPSLLREEARERPDHETPARVAQRREHSRVLYEVLDTISEKKRMVIVLHEILGYSPKEISETLGVNVLTVRTRLHYARKELYAKMLETELFKDEAS